MKFYVKGHTEVQEGGSFRVRKEKELRDVEVERGGNLLSLARRSGC
jgi:hypothetical protein